MCQTAAMTLFKRQMPSVATWDVFTKPMVHCSMQTGILYMFDRCMIERTMR